MTAKKQSKEDVAALLEEEAAAIDADRDAPITDATTVTRGHGRSKTLQIRLNPEELEELERIAASRGLPTSTVAREAILRLIRPVEARAAAASRLVDEFARYVDSLVAEGGVRMAAGVSQYRPAITVAPGLRAVDTAWGRVSSQMAESGGPNFMTVRPVLGRYVEGIRQSSAEFNQQVDELLHLFEGSSESASNAP